MDQTGFDRRAPHLEMSLLPPLPLPQVGPTGLRTLGLRLGSLYRLPIGAHHLRSHGQRGPSLEALVLARTDQQHRAVVAVALVVPGGENT